MPFSGFVFTPGSIFASASGYVEPNASVQPACCTRGFDRPLSQMLAQQPAIRQSGHGFARGEAGPRMKASGLPFPRAFHGCSGASRACTGSLFAGTRRGPTMLSRRWAAAARSSITITTAGWTFWCLTGSRFGDPPPMPPTGFTRTIATAPSRM